MESKRTILYSSSSADRLTSKDLIRSFSHFSIQKNDTRILTSFLLARKTEFIQVRKPGFESQLTASKNIIRVGWKENVQDFLSISHVNVFPSEREGLPVNLMESLAMGVPVITSSSRGCREVVRHELDGVILEYNNLSELIQAMEMLIEDKERLEKFSSAALEGRDRFSRKQLS